MTSWWNKNSENRIDDFKSWVGNQDNPSKKYCRKYIADKQYKSIIDCGCGLASEYYGYQEDKYNINYTGLDSCTYFNTINKDNGIQMIESELEKDLPIIDNSYECVFCREVLEHLSFYEKAISEFIRIGKKEIIICWFIKPTTDDDEINYWEEEDLYHNKYNISKLEKFVLSNTKVEKLFWEDIDQSILHIVLKKE